MAVLSLSNAHLAFGHVALLDGAAFSLESGERLALIGRNGTGKSSLLKIVAGLEKPDDGLLQLTQNLRIRYVAQEPVLDPAATVFDAVSEGVAEAKAVRAAYEAHEPGTDLDALQTQIEHLDAWTWEQRVDTTLAHLTLDGARVVGELSGGMKKRVALAQMLILDPQLLLMDEPFSALDIQTRQLMENELLDLWSADRKSVLFITHDLEEAISLSDRVIVLSAGPATHPIGDFTIDLPRPRDVAEIRMTPRFVELHSAIWQTMKTEVLKGYAQSQH